MRNQRSNDFVMVLSVNRVEQKHIRLCDRSRLDDVSARRLRGRSRLDDVFARHNLAGRSQRHGRIPIGILFSSGFNFGNRRLLDVMYTVRLHDFF
jgi:hypothetical protein